jgi:hypothetical protein
MKVRKLGPNRSKRRGYGEAIAYLRVENPRFLFLGGSADVVAAAAPPAISAVRADASAACVTSLVGCLAAGAPAPTLGAVSSAASAALGERGEGSHLSRGARPPSLSSSSSLSDDEYSEVPGGEEPLLLAQPELLTPLFPVLLLPDPLLLLARRPLLLPPLRRARARARGVGGSDRAAFC